MVKYIELQYLSPTSNYVFDKNITYTIVLVNSASNNTIHIYKKDINQIDNVNSTIRAYPIKKSIRILPSMFKQSYCVKIFSHDKSINKISLLFTGILDLENLEKNNYNYIVLDKPPTVLGKPREIDYVDNSSYIEEPFYNFEKLLSKESCFLFIRRLDNTNLELLNSTIIKFDLLSNNIYTYDRYNNTVIKEFMPSNVHNIIDKTGYNTTAKQHLIHGISFIENFCTKQNSYKGYINFLKLYQRDDRIFIGQQQLGNLKYMLSRRVLPDFRQLNIDPYSSNTIVSPADGRIRGFQTTNNLKIVIYNRIYTPAKFKVPEIINGSGFLCRVNPQDYQRVHMPYSGYIKTLNLFIDSNNTCITTLEFESTYFMPPDVSERDLLSSTRGSPTYGGVGVGAASRSYPELSNPQPATHLSFYIIIISPSKDSFIFTNKKLENVATKPLVKQIWFEQGEEFGKIMCGNACVISLFNRPIDFTSDINYYSKLDQLTPLHKPIDTFVKARDIIGTLL